MIKTLIFFASCSSLLQFVTIFGTHPISCYGCCHHHYIVEQQITYTRTYHTLEGKTAKLSNQLEVIGTYFSSFFCNSNSNKSQDLDNFSNFDFVFFFSIFRNIGTFEIFWHFRHFLVFVWYFQVLRTFFCILGTYLAVLAYLALLAQKLNSRNVDHFDFIAFLPFSTLYHNGTFGTIGTKKCNSRS